MRTGVVKERRGRAAWSLVEVMVAVAVLAILFVSLFAGFGFGFKVVKATREDLRATQILTQKIESVRLCTYSQLTNLCPMNFTENYTSMGPGSSSVVYSGTITDGPNTNLPAAYRDKVRLVTVTVTWTTTGSGASQSRIVHTRSMQTESAYYGLQNYLYGVTNSI